jgi:hypothetical protein
LFPGNWSLPANRIRKNNTPGVILSEAKNLSSIEAQSAERFFGEKRASE